MMRTTIRLKEDGIRFAAIDLPGRRLFNQKWLASFGMPWRSIVKRFTAVWILLFLLLLLAFVPLVISEFSLFPD